MINPLSNYINLRLFHALQAQQGRICTYSNQCKRRPRSNCQNSTPVQQSGVWEIRQQDILLMIKPVQFFSGSSPKILLVQMFGL